MRVHSKAFALRKPFSERTEGYAVMCCGLMQFLSESLHTQNLFGVVVLRALYSPLHNWSLTISSDPCQSSVRVMSAVVHGRRREAQYNHDFEQLG